MNPTPVHVQVLLEREGWPYRRRVGHVGEHRREKS